MHALIQKLHPALHPGQRLTLASSGTPVFVQQGAWDRGGALHCLAVALAMLGKLSNPAGVRDRDGAEADFWNRAFPHYLHSLTLSELASFIWELDMGVQPVSVAGGSADLLRFCEREVARRFPVIVSLHARGLRRALLVTGIEGARQRRFSPQALLVLDPLGAAPVFAASNARLEPAAHRMVLVTATGRQDVKVEGAVSVRLRGRELP